MMVAEQVLFGCTPMLLSAHLPLFSLAPCRVALPSPRRRPVLLYHSTPKIRSHPSPPNILPYFLPHHYSSHVSPTWQRAATIALQSLEASQLTSPYRYTLATRLHCMEDSCTQPDMPHCSKRTTKSKHRRTLTHRPVLPVGRIMDPTRHACMQNKTRAASRAAKARREQGS